MKIMMVVVRITEILSMLMIKIKMTIKIKMVTMNEDVMQKVTHRDSGWRQPSISVILKPSCRYGGR